MRFDDLPDYLSGSELEYLDRIFELLDRNITSEELLKVVAAMNNGVSAERLANDLRAQG